MIKRVRSAILCDEVRTEDNKKLFYIGVYGHQVICSAKPAALNLTLSLQIEVDEQESKVEIRTVGDGIKRSHNLTVPGGISIVQIMIMVNVAVVEPRDLTVYVKIGEAWVETGNWQIIFAENVATMAERDAAAIIATRDQNRATSEDFAL